MDNTQETFQYTYAAKERTEVEQIREKYLPPAENKLEQLRALDRSATRKAQMWALTLGTLGSLILGTGMSLIMTDLGSMLHLHSHFAMPIGVSAGLLGLGMVALAYPLYNRMLKKERRRIAPEILRLTDELMK